MAVFLTSFCGKEDYPKINEYISYILAMKKVLVSKLNLEKKNQSNYLYTL